MAINPTRINTSPLASYAANSLGSLSLDHAAGSIPSARLGPISGGNAPSPMEMMRLQEAKKQAAQQQSQAQARMQLQKQKLGLQKQKLKANIRTAALQMAKEDSEATIEKKAAAATMYLQSEELQNNEKATAKYINRLKEQGTFSEEDANDFMKMDPDERIIAAKSMIVASSGALKQIKAVTKKDEDDSGGGTTGATGEGEETQELTTAQQSRTQKRASDAEFLQAGIQDVQELYDPAFLTWKVGAGKQASVWANKSKGLPGIEETIRAGARFITGLNEEERDKLVWKMTKFVTKSEQLFQEYRKRITGAQASDREIKMLREIFLNPEMGPVEFKAAMEVLVEAAQRDQDISRKQLREGIIVKVGDAKYGEDESQSVTSTSGSTQQPSQDEQPSYSQQDIIDTANKYNITPARVEEIKAMDREDRLEALRELRRR